MFLFYVWEQKTTRCQNSTGGSSQLPTKIEFENDSYILLKTFCYEFLIFCMKLENY